MAWRSLKSVANFTILKTLPWVSKMGLYEPKIHTRRPPLATRKNSPQTGWPWRNCAQPAA